MGEAFIQEGGGGEGRKRRRRGRRRRREKKRRKGVIGGRPTAKPGNCQGENAVLFLGGQRRDGTLS